MNSQRLPRNELIAAALAGDLSGEERVQFDQLRASDPSVQEELDEMDRLVASLHATVPDWSEEEPSAGFRPAVLAIPFAETVSSAPGSGDSPATADHPVAQGDRPVRTSGGHRHTSRRRSRPRRGRQAARMVAVAAGFFIVGVGVTLGVQAVQDAPPQGPPGTYGAVEAVDFTTETGEAEIDAALVAHTWGTETVLEVDGLPPGESFTVVLIDEAGDEVHSGAFIGSELLIECRLNADVMRHDATRLEITGPDGDIVVAADLPDAINPEQHQARP